MNHAQSRIQALLHVLSAEDKRGCAEMARSKLQYFYRMICQPEPPNPTARFIAALTHYSTKAGMSPPITAEDFVK